MQLQARKKLAQWRSELGLDKPIPVQYAIWLGLDPILAAVTGKTDPVNGVLQGDFGYSIATKRPIVEEIGPKIVPTLWLMLTAFTIALVTGVTVGVVTAIRQYSKLDYALTGITVLLASTPPFVIGLAAIYVFAVNWGVLPTGGMEPLGGAKDRGLPPSPLPPGVDPCTLQRRDHRSIYARRNAGGPALGLCLDCSGQGSPAQSRDRPPRPAQRLDFL